MAGPIENNSKTQNINFREHKMHNIEIPETTISKTSLLGRCNSKNDAHKPWLKRDVRILPHVLTPKIEIQNSQWPLEKWSKQKTDIGAITEFQRKF